MIPAHEQRIHCSGCNVGSLFTSLPLKSVALMLSPSFSHCQPCTPRAEWLRVLAGYLVAIFLLHSVVVAVQLGAGPLHRHRDTPATLATLLFAHQDPSQGQAHAHAHAHANGERHHHEVADSNVVAMAESGAADAVTSALCSTLNLLAIGQSAAWAALLDTGRHVQRAAPPWARHTAPSQTVYRPPWLA